MIPYGKHTISEDDINAVVKVLRSDFITQGPVVPKFEEKLCNYTSADYAVAVNSCTSALHIACLALDLSHGDILWTSPMSFVASANCALYSGAKVDFVDIDPKTALMSITHLEEKLIKAKKENKLPKIVIPVHYAGQSCDMKAISKLGIEYGFRIIEDAAHGIGAKYLNNSVGGCEYSDITVFSFHPVKIITTGEGGAALTNNAELNRRMRLLRSHGVTRDSKDIINHDAWYYEQISLGYNYRMTDLQAALGVSQIDKLDDYVMMRHSLSKSYDRLLKDLPVQCLLHHKDSYSSKHLYPIQLELEKIKYNRSQVFSKLREMDIGVNVHYIPIHTQPYYRNFGFNIGDYPEAEQYYKRALTLPLYPGLTKEQQDEIVQKLKMSLEL